MRIPEDSSSAPSRGPSLRIAPAADSAPGAPGEESPPAPLLVPGRPGADTTATSRAASAREKFRLGLGFERQGLGAPAIAAYQSALRLDPSFPQVNYHMGRIYLTRGELREAARCFAGEVRRHPENLTADRELGLALARLGDSTRAIARLERLTRARPDDDENWRALGFAYSTAGRTPQAEEVLRRAIKLSPQRAAEHRDLGVLLASAGREEEAREEYRKALALDRKDASVWLNLANLERRAGHLERALELYREAEARDSNFSLAVQGQIGALTQLERDAEAGAVYRRWLRTRPDDHNARLEAVRHFNGLGRGDIGLELARDGVRWNRRSGDAHMILGIALQYRGDARAALAELRSAEKLFPERGARAKVRDLIVALRAGAPDSLRAMFEADSVAHAEKADSLARPARADSAAGGGKP